MRQWRLIYDTPTSGSRNMAVDEAILTSVGKHDSPPTLRLYGWTPPCLSLGYGQRVSDVDLAGLTARGWQLVRRPTGGRAILHTDELTYSVALPEDDPIAAGDVLESYRRISRALVAGLARLGIMPQSDRRAEQGVVGAVCFETPSHYEITVNRRKLVGSAQVRRRGGILQHGSLPLYGDIARICDALGYADESSREEAKHQVRARATTLAEASGGKMFTWEQAAEAIVQGFAETFVIDFETSGLTADESDYARELMTNVYGHEGWTFKR